MTAPLSEPPDFLPISMLNQLEYCPRRFWLMYVQGEMAVNAVVLEGTLQHERVHTGTHGKEGEVVQRRHVPVFSQQLRLTGVADLLEVRDGALVVVEYKHGKLGKWLNDHVQLCAQALCVEEQLRAGSTLPVWASGLQDPCAPLAYGEVFYWESRQRQRIDFSQGLRERTVATIAQAFAMLQAGQLPLPITQKAKCRDCSLEPICLPQETLLLRGK